MKINNMHKYIKMFNRKLLLTFSLIITILSSLSCVDGAGDKQVISLNPENVAIIVFNSIPGQFWGNGTDVDSIKINTGLIPNGSTITAKITNSSLPDELSGCVVSGSATVINGMATFNFLAPIFIGNMGETQQVNLAVTIETPDGTKINDFVTLTILAVGIEPPADATVMSPAMLDPDPGFLNLEFSTFGFAAGTMATCSVGNPALGSISAAPWVVTGNKAQGKIVLQYIPAAGTPSGEQTVTCAIIIQNPSSVGASCSNVGVSDRTASATAFIDQGASDDVVNPPTPNSMTCNPDEVTQGASGTCTCNNDNAAGQTINFGGSTHISFPMAAATADVNGTATVTYNSGGPVLMMPVTEQVTCGPAANPLFAQTSITINPAPPAAATDLSCVPNPANSGDTLVCTCTTNQTDFARICYEYVMVPGDMTQSVTFPGAPMNCVTSDSNGTGIIFASTMTDVLDNDVLQCCVDTDADGDMDDDCEGENAAQTTEVVNPPAPVDIDLTLTALNDMVAPLAQTILTCQETGAPVMSELCAEISIDGSNGGTAPMVTPTCGTADNDGIVNFTYTAGDQEGQDVATCCLSGGDGTCDDGDQEALVEITVTNEAGPPDPEVMCTSNPGMIIPGNNSSITATYANLPVGYDQACFNIVGQTMPVSSLSNACVPIVINGGSTIFMSDPAIVAPQNAFVACCADQTGNIAGCFDAEGEIISPFPVLVQVNPAAPSPYAIIVTPASGTTNIAASTMDFVNMATNPPVPGASGANLCLILAFDGMGGSMIADSDEGPVGVGSTICEPLMGVSGAITMNFAFTSGPGVSGDIADLIGCIDLSANSMCDPGEPIDTLTYTIP